MEALGGEFKGLGRSHLGHRAHRHGVIGVLHRLIHRHLSPVDAVHIHWPRLAAQHLIGVVGHDGDGAHQAHLNGRGIGGQGLDGGTGLPLGVGSQVQAPVDLLLTDPAHQGGDVPGLVVNDGDGRLKALARALGDIVQKLLVPIDGLRLFLDLRVDAGVDPQASAGQHLAGHLVGVVVLFLQILDYVGDDLLLVPGVDVLRALRVAAGARLHTHKDQLLGHRLIVLLLGDVPLLEHLVQNELLAVLVPLLGVPQLPLAVGHLGQGVRAVFGGVIGDGNEAGTLGQGQLRHRLSEIFFGGSPHTLAAGAQGDDIQIPQQRGVLVIVPVKLQRTEDLRHLPLHRGLIVLRQVLDELLGDGGAALDVSAGEHTEHRLGGAPPVHPVVLQEAPVLNGDRRIFQILRDLLILHPLGADGGEHLSQLLILAAVILIVHHAVFPQGDVPQVQRSLREDDRPDVDRPEAAQDGPGGHGDEQQGTDHPQCQSAPAAPLFRAAGPVSGPLAGAAAGPGPAFLPGSVRRIVLFRHRNPSEPAALPASGAPNVHGDGRF